jgi:hypothetical protein
LELAGFGGVVSSTFKDERACSRFRATIPINLALSLGPIEISLLYDSQSCFANDSMIRGHIGKSHERHELNGPQTHRGKTGQNLG